MTLTIGWWVVPLFLTIIAFVIPIIRDMKRTDHHDMFSGLPLVIEEVGAIIFSLVVWLIWALLR